MAVKNEVLARASRGNLPERVADIIDEACDIVGQGSAAIQVEGNGHHYDGFITLDLKVRTVEWLADPVPPLDTSVSPVLAAAAVVAASSSSSSSSSSESTSNVTEAGPELAATGEAPNGPTDPDGLPLAGEFAERTPELGALEETAGAATVEAPEDTAEAPAPDPVAAPDPVPDPNAHLAGSPALKVKLPIERPSNASLPLTRQG